MQEGLRQTKSKVNQLPSPFAFFAEVVRGQQRIRKHKKRPAYHRMQVFELTRFLEMIRVLLKVHD